MKVLIISLLAMILNMFIPSFSFAVKLITHHENLNIDIGSYRTRLNKLAKANALTLPLEEELELLDNLNKFEFGRFLLHHRGINSYWSSYLVSEALKKTLTNPLEHWLVYSAPSIKAARERFRIFQKQLQKYLKDNISVATIPCGAMDDLLSIDYSNFKNIRLIGIDIDDRSLALASKNAIMYNKEAIVSLSNKDAWNLGTESKYDIILSNGLNIYEPDDKKVIALYKELRRALTSEGVLITSFLTTSTTRSNETTGENFNEEDFKKQKAIFRDILHARWQWRRTESQTRKILQRAGFKVINIIYDSQGIFPTVIAKKAKNKA